MTFKNQFYKEEAKEEAFIDIDIDRHINQSQSQGQDISSKSYEITKLRENLKILKEISQASDDIIFKLEKEAIENKDLLKAIKSSE